jgi:nucleoside-diphosphate-sugar epimerase
LEIINRKILNEVEIVPGDIRDFERVESAVSDCQLVFNLAALIGIPYSYLAPSSYIDTNVNGILNVLQSTKNENIRIIQTSTSKVYGRPLNLPIKETHRLYAQSPYVASKIAADQMALSFYNLFKTIT